MKRVGGYPIFRCGDDSFPHGNGSFLHRNEFFRCRFEAATIRFNLSTIHFGPSTIRLVPERHGVTTFRNCSVPDPCVLATDPSFFAPERDGADVQKTVHEVWAGHLQPTAIQLTI